MIDDDNPTPGTDEGLIPFDPEELLRVLKLVIASENISFAEKPAFLAKGGEAVIHAFDLKTRHQDLMVPWC